MKSGVQKLWGYIGGINGLLLILYSIFVFSTAVITSSNFSKFYFIISEMLIIVLSVIICPIIIKTLSKISIKQSKQKIRNQKSQLFLKLAFYIIPLCLLFVYYLAYYPGGFSPDSISQYTQAINNQYSDWHPVIQTLFAFKLPLTLTGGWIGSIVLFQIICFSAVLGYSFNTIYKFTNLKYTVLSIIFLLFNPQLGYIAMYPWKDISFAIGALLLLTYSLRIYFTKGDWIKKPLNTVVFIITASLTTLFRHNALLFTIPLIIAVLLYMTKKRGLIICISVIVLCLGIKLPLYSAIGVTSPDKRQIETLGLPMTIIGAVVTHTPEALDAETREFAYKVAPKEVWEEKYKDGSYNAVKWDDRTNNDVIEEYGTQKVISMMFKSINASKRVALTSLIKLTEASYSVTDDYDDFIYPGIAENQYGITQSINGRAAAICEAYRDFIKDFLSYPFLHLGFLHLILIVSVLSKCRLNKIKNWKKILFVIPIFAYNLGTTVLLTGIDDATRFFFYSFLLIPTSLIFLFRNDEERSTDSIVRNTI